MNIFERAHLQYLSMLMHSLPFFKFECACAFQNNILGEEMRQKMDRQAHMYDERLQKIYTDYKMLNDSQFVVNLNIFKLDMWSFPSRALSYFDCFHPRQVPYSMLLTLN
jgi:hypothetical protein